MTMRGNNQNLSNSSEPKKIKPQPTNSTRRPLLKKLLKRNSPVKRDNQGKFTSGNGGLKSAINLKWQRFVPVVAVISLVGGFLVYQSFASNGLGLKTYDLRTYYPNNQLFTKQYLEGNNYIKGTPDRSVLWFEKQDQYTFRMYNAAPQNGDRRCNYDVLSWWPDNTFRYSETYNDCGDYVANKIVYDSPIVFLPATWNSRAPWQFKGTSAAKYYELDGTNKMVQKCTGTTQYTAKIFGIENVTPTEPAIRWQTTQTTYWQTGAVPGKCTAGYTTRWQEDYWLTDTVATTDGSEAKGLRRTKGGNLDSPQTGWDVWYDAWSALPAPLASPEPTKRTSTQ